MPALALIIVGTFAGHAVAGPNGIMAWGGYHRALKERKAELAAIGREFGADKFQPVVPKVSLLAEFPVSVVDKVVDARGSRVVAEAYLDFLYSPAGQEIIVGFGNRVGDAAIMEKHAAEFPPVELITVEEAFGGWKTATEEHFAEGGLLDEVFVAQ